MCCRFFKLLEERKNFNSMILTLTGAVAFLGKGLILMALASNRSPEWARSHTGILLGISSVPLFTEILHIAVLSFRENRKTIDETLPVGLSAVLYDVAGMGLLCTGIAINYGWTMELASLAMFLGLHRPLCCKMENVAANTVSNTY